MSKKHNAYEFIGAKRNGPWLVTCDHASNHVPEWVGDLGIAAKDMERHIAYDVGARGVALALAKRLDSAVICSRFSRLVIDPNRGEDDPTLIMRLYDGTIIPANRHLSDADKTRRIECLYRPYHTTYEKAAMGKTILAIHSFTPSLQNYSPRPWHIGVLHSPRDNRLSKHLIKRLREEPDLCVGDNEPYSGHLPGDAIDRHALDHNRANTLIELRNDLIPTSTQQEAWASRLAPILQEILATLKKTED